MTPKTPKAKAPRQFTGVRLDADLIAGLEELKALHHTPYSAAVRQAVREYLERKGVIEKRATKPKRRSQ